MAAKNPKPPATKATVPGEKFRVQSKITSKWQITVPKAVRKELAIQPGDELIFIGTREGILVKRHVDLSALDKWTGYLKHLAGRDVDDVVRELRGR